MITAAERELRRMLAELAREYQEYAAPIRAALARIEALKPPRAIFITTGELSPDVLERLRWIGVDPAGGPDSTGTFTVMDHEKYIAVQDNGRAWPQADNE